VVHGTSNFVAPRKTRIKEIGHTNTHTQSTYKKINPKESY